MVKFAYISQIEHGDYPFVYAVASADTFNGAYGAKGDKLESDASGKLVKGATVAPYLEVTGIVGNHLGVEVKVVATATE